MSSQSCQDVLRRIDAAADQLRDQLVSLSLRIHANPEIAFQEHEAARLLAAALEEAGFQVERGSAGMDTAFLAQWRGGGGGDRPAVAFVAEYDALPEVGHACGHNIIGTAAAGAAMALKRACPGLAGTLFVMGTPAEEGGGGKILMVNAGLFDAVDAALMIHPTTGESRIGSTSLATSGLVINFRGKPAHAAGAPHKGINALDAVVQTYVNVSLLRQHLAPDVRLHCLITKGGSVINIVPEEAEIRYLLRASAREGVDLVTRRVRECAEGAGRATMATVSFVETSGYDERVPNKVLGDLFTLHLERVGVAMNPEPAPSGGSTDFGNVSKRVPASNAYVSIGPKEVASHSREFAVCAASEAGHLALMNSVKAMAGAAYDVLCDAALRERAKQEFDRRAAEAKAGQ
ncbi:MAG: M20 family metallopeptidase [Bacillota bacterium]|nr:M20 family metallopeptidase [Bacillota bacterium]